MLINNCAQLSDALAGPEYADPNTRSVLVSLLAVGSTVGRLGCGSLSETLSASVPRTVFLCAVTGAHAGVRVCVCVCCCLQGCCVGSSCVACVSVWSWLALQFALQDLKTALIAMLQVYTHWLYGTVWYTTSVCVCVCVCVCVLLVAAVCGGVQVCVGSAMPVTVCFVGNMGPLVRQPTPPRSWRIQWDVTPKVPADGEG